MRRWTLGGISRLWSPQKSKADEAVPTPSPLADHHPNRIQKPRDRTPKTYSRKGTARAQKLAARLGTSSELEEASNGGRLSSRHESEASARYDGGGEELMEDEHADPDGNEDEDPDDELAQYASQPAPIDSMSPTIGRSTQETDGGVPATQAEPGLEYDAFALSGSETPGERDYDSDNYQQYTFTKLLNYRWVPDDNAIELEVQWHNDESTWEPETNLHRDAPDALFRFWAAQGGRPDNPREPGLFDIFAIRGHSRNRQSLLVEWTGYPPSENCWVSRKVLHETAPEVVDDYMRNISRK